MTNTAPRSTEIVTARMSQAAIDAGLRQFMISVYNYMASGLALTGIVAYGAAETGLYASLIDTPMLFWGVTLAPLALVLLLSFRIEKIRVLGAAKTAFWAYAARGRPVSFRNLLRLYRHEHCSNLLHHRRDLPRHEPLRLHHSRRSSTHRLVPIDGVGRIIIASIVNVFLASSIVQLAISVVGVIVFVGLTAYDTQRIKEIYLNSDRPAIAGKKAIMGALALYLDFLNLFILLMQLTGNRRD